MNEDAIRRRQCMTAEEFLSKELKQKGEHVEKTKNGSRMN